MSDNSDILTTEGYESHVRRDIYFNRKTKKVFTSRPSRITMTRGSANACLSLMKSEVGVSTSTVRSPNSSWPK